MNDIPQHAEAVKNKLNNNIEYVRQNIPRPIEGIEMSRKDYKRLLSIVEAAFDPQTALVRAITEKDQEMMKHVRALAGNTYSEVVAKVNMLSDLRKMPREKKAILNMLNSVESQQQQAAPPSPGVETGVPAAQPSPGRPPKPDLDLGTQTEKLPGDAIQR